MLAQQKDNADNSLNMTMLLLGTSFTFMVLRGPSFIF